MTKEFIQKNNSLLLRDGTSMPGDSESEVPPEPGPPEIDRLNNFLLGDDGVPSLDSRSLDSDILNPWGWCNELGDASAVSSSGVCGNVGHSWSSI